MTCPTSHTPAREDTREGRVAYVVRLIAIGLLEERHDLALCKRWEVSPSVAREIIAEARRAWRRSLDPDEQADLAYQLAARLDRIYSLAMKAGDLKAATAAIRERGRIAGLDKRTLVVAAPPTDRDDWVVSDDDKPDAH